MKQKTRACCPPPHEVFLHKRPAVFLWLIECHFEFCLSPLQWPKPFGGVWASVSGLEVLERLFCRGHAIASCLFSAGVRSDSLECLLFKRARGKEPRWDETFFYLGLPLKDCHLAKGNGPFFRSVKEIRSQKKNSFFCIIATKGLKLFPKMDGCSAASN